MGEMEDDALLAVIHRGRPATTAEVADLADLTRADVDAALGRLHTRGLIGTRDGHLTYRHPADWAAEAVSASASELRRSAADTLREIERIVTGMPEMLRRFSVGEVSADLVPVLTRHGPHASEDLWFDTARHDGGSLEAVLPDVGRFLSTDDERVIRFSRALLGKESVRVIIPTATLADPPVRDRMVRFGRAGVAYRSMDVPPS